MRAAGLLPDPAPPDVVVYSRGRFRSGARARIPALDRGFLFGDGVFETVRTYGRRPFRLSAHLARLRRSAGAVRLAVPLDDGEIGAIVDSGIARLHGPGGAEVAIRLLVTRGCGAPAYPLPVDPHPELYAFFAPLSPPRPEDLARGVNVVTMSEEKPARFTSVKLMGSVPAILARADARERGAYEVVRINAAGRVAEGFISNVFVVRPDGRTLVTPPDGEGLLAGVTRQVVLDLARERALRVVEEPVPREALPGAREIFLTHTSAGVVPVVAVDDVTIGRGVPGEVARGLVAWFATLAEHPERVEDRTRAKRTRAKRAPPPSGSGTPAARDRSGRRAPPGEAEVPP
jgi:branched-subunit amino acid aminotransferase/4-amino-4-deoxychorismate lyase